MLLGRGVNCREQRRKQEMLNECGDGGGVTKGFKDRWNIEIVAPKGHFPNLSLDMWGI